MKDNVCFVCLIDMKTDELYTNSEMDSDKCINLNRLYFRLLLSFPKFKLINCHKSIVMTRTLKVYKMQLIFKGISLSFLLLDLIIVQYKILINFRVMAKEIERNKCEQLKSTISNC